MSEFPPLNCDLAVPLVIDLDGTLVPTDTLHEALFLLLKRDWSRAWRVPLWILQGRAVVKERLGALVTDHDVAHFPVNVGLLEFAEREAERGRKIVLATAADRRVAEKVAERFSVISNIMASDGRTNLRGSAKAEALSEVYPEGFIYAGDSYPDLEVWRRSSGAIFVGDSRRLFEKVKEATHCFAAFPPPSLGLNGLKRALRLHQWAKNALIFVPLILSGKIADAGAWMKAFEGFLTFGMLASATYLLNDLWDLHEDRQHWSKKDRPLASGEMQIALSLALIVLLGLGAFALAFVAARESVALLAIYLAATLGYSFRLKREPIVDVVILAGLFTMRLGVGVVVAGVAFSTWLLVFSMFFFLSVSLGKRQTEIVRMAAHGKDSAPGRGYRAKDAFFVLASGVATMIAAVLIVVIYLIEDAFPKGVYQRPDLLWSFPVVIFLWLGRFWILCHRGDLHDDPVAFALKDRLSLVYAAVVGAVFAAAIA
jgi:4-hydroxybenzoate polyprenyltransferase/phosphoserine phosphatase